jgi:cell division protein FtsN
MLGALAVAWLEPAPEAVLASIKAMRGESESPRATARAERKPRFEFYHLLPEMEVAVPEHELDAPAPRERLPPPAQPGETPAPARGAYVIQVGSFKGRDEAERLRATLALQGIEAHVQSVAIDGRQTWHRVRLGPFDGFQAMNEMRKRLRRLDVSAMVLELKR